MSLTLKVKLLDGFLPEWKDYGNAGLDLKAAEDTLLWPGKVSIVRLGIMTEFSNMFVGSIRDRGGLASKGLHTMAGVVDSNYRGEWKVVMVNLTDDGYVVKKGERIAQVLFQPIVHLLIEEVSDLAPTGRGATGFGASGQF